VTHCQIYIVEVLDDCEVGFVQVSGSDPELKLPEFGPDPEESDDERTVIVVETPGMPTSPEISPLSTVGGKVASPEISPLSTTGEEVTVWAAENMAKMRSPPICLCAASCIFFGS